MVALRSCAPKVGIEKLCNKMHGNRKYKYFRMIKNPRLINCSIGNVHLAYARSECSSALDVKLGETLSLTTNESQLLLVFCRCKMRMSGLSKVEMSAFIGG